MELILAALGEVVLVAALARDLARVRARPRADGVGRIEPFRIWFMRVHFFSVFALPFYFWRTRGWRWSVVGLVWALVYVGVLEGAMGMLVGCSAGSPDARTSSARAAADAGRGTPAGEGRQAAPAGDGVVDRALQTLRTSRFPDVLAAHDVLLDAATPQAVAGLVALASSPERVPLQDTQDLIYPGTRRFHGHGLVVPYDLDRLGARAGWVLEILTFRDFGFSRAAHPDAPEPAERPDAAARAQAWWSAQGGRFARLDAFAAALRAPGDSRGDAVLAFAGAVPMPDATRAALGSVVVPALVEGLGASSGAQRSTLCRVARLLVLHELSRTDPRLREVLERPLAGDANLVAALHTTLAPEVAFEVDVPGAAEILSPAYAMHARDALEELLRRLAYARGEDHVGLALAPGRIVVYAGDPSREAEAWRAWLR